MPKIVALIDALGYSAHTGEDLKGAVQLLADQQHVLARKLEDTHRIPPGLEKFTAMRGVSAFKHFLPFSDSTFIVSEQPDQFLPQLAHFLIACFNLKGHAYRNGTEASRPEEVPVKVIGVSNLTTEVEYWYPPIWRGGLGEGTLHVFDSMALRDGNAIQVPNLSGTAVVNAARAEAGGRGPRLFCAPDFSRHFGPHLQRFFRRVDDDYSEFLWPAFTYGDGNPSGEINQFSELWFPAVGLWRSKKNTAAFEHYDEFLKLLIRSCLCWARNADYETEATAFVRQRVQNDLGADLMDLEPLAMGVLP